MSVDGWNEEGPWLTTVILGWNVRALKGVGPLEGIVAVQVHSPDGRRFAAEFGTLEVIAGLMRGYSESGECLGGAYFFTQSLVILSEMNAPHLRRALADIIETQQIEPAFELLGDQ
jgi:hypothetical protein